MRFTKTIIAALSAAAAQAVIITNADFSDITVGVPFVITYADAVGPVTVYLGSGSPANVLQGNAVGSSSGATGSITWTPASGGSYALKIVDTGAPTSSTNPNYSGFFLVNGPVISAPAPQVAAAGVAAAASTTATSFTTMTTPMTNVTTSSVIAISTGYSNGTVTIGSSTITGVSSFTDIPSQIPNSMASGISSSLAFVFAAVGALLTFN